MANFYISSAARFRTSLLTCSFIYNRLLRKICEPGKKDQNTREEYMMTSFTICSRHKINYDQINEYKMEGACGMQGGEEKCIPSCDWETCDGREGLEDVSVDRRIILNCMLKELDGTSWDGFKWLRLGTRNGFL